jgi:replicative DNA helicase
MSALAAVTPPSMCNVEAETCLLGGMMAENNVIDAVADIVRAEDFSDEFCAGLFGLIVSEHSRGRQANPVTLHVHFDPETAQLLPTLTRDWGMMGVFGAKGLASQVADLARRRRMVAGLREVISGAHDYENQTEQLAADAEAAISEAFSQDESARTSISAGDAIAEFVEGLNEPDNGVISGLIPSLDNLLGKLRPGDLCVVAGRPAMGKTTLAQSYSLGAAQGGHGVLFVSLEMSKRQLAGKFACDYLSDNPKDKIQYQSIAKRELAPNQRQSLARAAFEVRELPLVIEDLPGATIGKLARIVRLHSRRFAAKGTSLDLVVVDYLQLLDADERNLDIRSAVTKISRGLKSIAKANGVAIMALSQLNRRVEERADKRPHTNDLRESGQIEQDADQIVFLLRLEKYLRAEEPKEGTADWIEWRELLSRHAGKIEFIVAKNRHDVEGSAFGDWHGAFQAVRG